MNKALRISSQDSTRNNGFKHNKFRFSKEMERGWFSNIVIDEWHELSNHYIISAESGGSFKRRLNKFMNDDDRWKQVALFFLVLDASCSFPLFSQLSLRSCSLNS